MAQDYKRIRIRRFAPVEERETNEGRFWRKFKYPVIQRLTSPATRIEFNPVSPHEYAVTTAPRVSIFDPSTNAERRALTRMTGHSSGSYRSDGRALVVACENPRPLVAVFDARSRALIRSYKGHTGTIHATRFAMSKTHVISTGDDRSLRVWDLTSTQALTVVEGAAEDYIRAADVCAAAPNLVALGSYDHTVSLWDMRALPGVSAAVRRGESDEDVMDGEPEAAAAADEEEDDAEAHAPKRARAASGDDASEGAEDEDDDDDDSSDEDEDGDGDDDDDDDEDGEDDEEEAAEESVEHAHAAAHVAAGDAASSSRSSAGVRSGAARGAIMTVDHGEPVTQVLMLPGGSTMLSAGGTTVKLWDVVGGGKLLHSFSNHQKLITSMCLDGTESRLLTAGLDGLLKVYDMAAFAVTHTMRCEGAVLSMAVAPDNSRIVMGTTDSTLCIRQRIVKVAELLAERKSARLLRGGTYRYFLRGQTTQAAETDVKVAGARRHKLKKYDTLLKTFEYRKALDAALVTNDPVIVTSVFEELVARGGVHMAIAGRDEEALEPLLAFTAKHVVDPRFAPMLLDVAGVIIDTYAAIIGESPTIDALFVRLASRLALEVKLGAELLSMQGMLDALMSASTRSGGGHAGDDDE